jgi:hypothetical protein
MDWFDCNVGYGIARVPPAGGFAATPEELLEELGFCGVAEALVTHAAIRDESAQAGNRLVAEETSAHPRLHPIWAILPPQAGELGSVGDFLSDMRQHGVKALLAYPDEHRYLLNGLTLGPLLEEITARRIPLILGPKWAALTALLAEFPNLVVIVVGHGSWGEDRYYRPLMERYPGFHVDTANYALDGGVKAAVDRYGPERLLYGSGFPELQMGGSLLMVAQADVSEEAKAAIAGGNLRRLLAEVKLS